MKKKNAPVDKTQEKAEDLPPEQHEETDEPNDRTVPEIEPPEDRNIEEEEE